MGEVSESILNNVKKVCGIAADYKAFDEDLVMHINSELSVLNQVGVGPAEGLAIVDEMDQWVSLLEGEARLNMVKSYIYLKMRLLFDPPQTPPLITALEKQADMFLWRIREFREEQTWVPPATSSTIS